MLSVQLGAVHQTVPIFLYPIILSGDIFCFKVFSVQRFCWFCVYRIIYVYLGQRYKYKRDYVFTQEEIAQHLGVRLDGKPETRR